MKNENMISAAEFCECHHIEISFIDSLKETGLIEIATIEETSYIRESQLNDLEKIVRLYYDLILILRASRLSSIFCSAWRTCSMRLHC